MAAPTPTQAARMLDYRDALTKKIGLHERQAALFVKDAIERRRKGDQQGALLLIKRKKIHDAEVLQLRGMLQEVEARVAGMGEAAVFHEHVCVIQDGQPAIQSHASGDVGDIEELHAALAEQQHQLEQRAIDDELGQAWGPEDDEVGLAAELAELEARASVAGR